MRVSAKSSRSRYEVRISPGHHAPPTSWNAPKLVVDLLRRLFDAGLEEHLAVLLVQPLGGGLGPVGNFRQSLRSAFRQGLKSSMQRLPGEEGKHHAQDEQHK